jgi:purine nucleosidase
MLGRPRPGGLERFGVPGHPLHDPCVVAYLLWPELFSSRDCHVAVEMASEATMGRTTIDWWGTGPHAPNAHVIDRLDADELFRRLTRALATLPRRRAP